MSAITVAAAGAALGVRHAVEADHLAAVATLVDEGDGRLGSVGASWGLGHSLPIIVLGLLLVGLGIRVPDAVAAFFEVIVGIVLLGLGARMLWAVSRGTTHTSHVHGTGLHAHLTLGSLSVGWTHFHLDGESFLVGLIHGFAGSGALVVLLVSSAPSVDAAVLFLAAFSLLSIATMTTVSILWGRTMGTAISAYLRVLAGLFGIAVGGVLLFEQAVGFSLL
ncbi:MAG: tryptophan-rich sensory protein [Natronomonas sp.]|jgi:tryptophan-rich sensory protein|uniref:high-affinity nickel-transporter protein n=1 Tax=Natronomonas sp. TaxID=2184060 RepID=UPI0039895FD0